MPIRENFPTADSGYQGGQSDGYCYRVRFAGTNLVASYQMLKAFLAEEDYGDVPMPETVDELLFFKYARSDGHFLLFAQDGYWHFPIKILFVKGRGKASTLELVIYDQNKPRQLMRFYGF